MLLSAISDELRADFFEGSGFAARIEVNAFVGRDVCNPLALADVPDNPQILIERRFGRRNF